MFKNRKPCVIYSGKTTHYIPLNRGTQRGNPILAYLFILVLETVSVSIFIGENQNVQGLTIFSNQVFYIPFTDDSSESWSNMGQFSTPSPKNIKNHPEKMSYILFKTIFS